MPLTHRDVCSQAFVPVHAFPEPGNFTTREPLDFMQLSYTSLPQPDDSRLVVHAAAAIVISYNDNRIGASG
jgi:hypothetical protein